MEKESRLSFYKCKYNPDLGTPIIIITCTENKMYFNFTSEYFIFLPDKDEFWGKKLICSGKDKYIKFDLDFMFNKAKEKAHDKIIDYLHESNMGNNNIHFLLYDIELSETDCIDFIQLIQSGKMKEEIKKMASETKCSKLNEIIEDIIDEDYKLDFKETKI